MQSLTLSETSTAAGATGVTGTVGFTTSPTGTLIGGSSAVTFIAPGGTIFGGCPYSDCGPSSTYTFTDLTNPSGSGSAGPGVSVTGPIVSITVPNTIKAGDHVVLTVTAVTNPLAGPGNIEFTTSSEHRRLPSAARPQSPTPSAPQHPSRVLDRFGDGRHVRRRLHRFFHRGPRRRIQRKRRHHKHHGGPCHQPQLGESGDNHGPVESGGQRDGKSGNTSTAVPRQLSRTGAHR